MLPVLGTFHYVHHLHPIKGETHTHEKHELVYCLRGNGSVELEGEEQVFQTGTIYITAAGMPHAEQNHTESEIIYFYFDLPREEVVSGIFQDRFGRVLPILRRLQYEEKHSLFQSDAMKSAILQELLIETQRTTQRIFQDRSFLSVLSYLDENFLYDVDIPALAKKNGYSYDRFRHLFKEQTGLAPWDYILEKRIVMAKKLLENHASLSLTYVAHECGFGSSSLFSNAFKAKTGLTPSAFRKQLRGGCVFLSEPS